MGYSDVIDAQLNSMDLEPLQEALNSAAEDSGLLPELSTEQIIQRLLNGQPLFESDNILENLQDLFLVEVKSAIFLGCEIITICIIIGLLTEFSNSFGRKTVSSLGRVICSCVIIALCMGNFNQTYSYCSDTMNSLTSSMEILLPIMIPLLISMGGISSGGVLNPVIISAVTAFNVVFERVILPLIFISVIFTLINSLTEKNYVKKLSIFLRRTAVFLTGLAVTVFSGITAIQGIVTKSADGILINTAKFSIDNFVPIVGGFAADSLDMVISCMGLIKNVLGIVGIIIILCILVTPVIKILAVAVIYKILAVVAEPVAAKGLSDTFNELGTAAITMAVILATGAVMFLVFITIIMNIGGGGQWA